MLSSVGCTNYGSKNRMPKYNYHIPGQTQEQWKSVYLKRNEMGDH